MDEKERHTSLNEIKADLSDLCMMVIKPRRLLMDEDLKQRGN